MSIKNLTIGLAIFAGIFSSCNSPKPQNIKERAIEYMQNRPKNELEEIIRPLNQIYPYGQNHAQVQSKLDSIAYRDVFQSTTASKDSALVSAFNRIPQMANPPTKNESTIKLKSNLRKTRIRMRDYSILTKKHNSILLYKGEKVANEHLQFWADSINYRKFFEKHNLFNEKTQEIFYKVSRKIRP